MIVLDEIGLADLSPEKPIKVLHSELERKAVLTSGEHQQSPYSVVALSNWVIDAAQVNRGILISRTKAIKNDLQNSARELAEALINRYSEDADCSIIFKKNLHEFLRCIVETYDELDSNKDIGGDHFFSMRDFFFCVKVTNYRTKMSRIHINVQIKLCKHSKRLLYANCKILITFFLQYYRISSVRFSHSAI